MTRPGLPKGARVLITGGAGFLGGALVERCNNADRVTVYDTVANPMLSLQQANLEVVVGDVLDVESLARVMSGHDFIFHCAARLGVRTVSTRPVDTLDTNIRGSANVLAAASAMADVQRIVCFSTSEIYGRHALGARETDPAAIPAPGDPRWAYAASKLAEEHYALAYRLQIGLPVTIVRPFNVYGPRQAGEGAVANFIRSALRNSPIEVRSGGTQVRAWCYVDDLVDGVILAATRPEGNGHVFNVGNPKEIESTIGLAKRIVDLAGSRSTIEHVDGGAEVEERAPDVTKATELLGFEPTIDLTDGLMRTIAWFRKELA